MRTNCLWLGTLMEPNQKAEAAEVLNKILGIKSAKITQSAYTIPGGMSIVAFTIADSDVPKAAVKRLLTDDIKWESDYPHYAPERFAREAEEAA